jgi:hypothetical protein
MLWIAEGGLQMGSDRHYPEEAPAHRVHRDGFLSCHTQMIDSGMSHNGFR